MSEFDFNALEGGWVEDLVSQPGATTALKLGALAYGLAGSANPDEDFFYLGGPMTGIPQFNFPAFKQAAEVLRANGYNLVSPAELDDPETAAAAMQSADGAPGSGSANGETWSTFLARDVIICALPTCVGGIFLPGWEFSSGAKLEMTVLDSLGKQLNAVNIVDGHVFLVPIVDHAADRTAAYEKRYLDAVKEDQA